MPVARTPKRWPYRNARPARGRRVVRASDAPRGVQALLPVVPRLQVTRRQARIVLAAAAMAMLLSAAWWAYHSPWLTVSDVTIAGAKSISPRQVQLAAGIDGDSIFALDLRAAQARVRALPLVRTATVRKDGLHGVAISVQERSVWGSWSAAGTSVPVDADGVVLDGAAPKGAPVIIVADAQRPVQPGDTIDAGAVQLAARLLRESDASFGRKVLAFAYRQDSGLTAVLAAADAGGKPVWVTFGDGRDYDYKVAALYVLFQRAKEQELALNVVDLRYGDRLSFR
ncbi:MAG: FtsQ-type POTRA domain-containing protein [Dehalococcoidia bacterium]|nr:FtsQ-type POTRA domain-containing protein [Dehalococcoidia bacterium]